MGLTGPTAREQTCFIRKPQPRRSSPKRNVLKTVEVSSGPRERSHPKGVPYEKTAVNFLRARANDVPALSCPGHYEAERNEAGHRERLANVHERSHSCRQGRR